MDNKSDGKAAISLGMTDAEAEVNKFFSQTWLVHPYPRNELYADCLPIATVTSVANPSHSMHVPIATPI